MRKLCSYLNKKKKGSMAMVLALAIIIPIVMTTITSFIYVTFTIQQKIGRDMAEFQDIDNIASVAGDIGGYYLQHHIEATVNNPNSKNDVFWTQFAADNELNIKNYILNKMPAEYLAYVKEISVAYNKNITEYMHGFDTYGYNAIVVTVDIETNNTIEQHNLAYFIKNAAGYTNGGESFEKGELVYSWIS